MASHIHVLDGDVADKIAAGEVIERPASVVKELVENAVDAAARSIRIEVWQAGKEMIRVVDDGHGIPPEEAPLAFLRHATSKIRQADDLSVIRTLGFRGEALPSIASVSQVDMITHHPEASKAVKVTAADGKVETVPWQSPPGTQVEVKHLFYNTPARFKFLKSDTAERRSIVEYVTAMAFAHPDIAFRLTVEGREYVSTPGTGNLKETIEAVLGRDVVMKMIAVEGRSAWAHISGYIGDPTIAKGNRKSEWVFINGRWVQNRMLHAAIEKGYETLLTHRRYPVAIVHLHMDPTLIDVNVHPAKTEVRFRNERELFRHMMTTVRTALFRSDLSVPLGDGTREKLPHRAAENKGTHPREQSRLSWAWPNDTPSRNVFSARPKQVNEAPPVVEWSQGKRVVDQAPDEEPIPARKIEEEKVSVDPREILQYGEVYGQLANTYIIVHAPGGLWLIDQHVAHERILYEQFLQQAESTTPRPYQQLLTPIRLSLSPDQAALLSESIDMLQQAGFTVEDFGGNDFLLRSVPADLHTDPRQLIVEMLEELTDQEERRTSFKERLAAAYSCRAAVKAGDPLQPEQCRALLQSLSQLDNPFRCPHGRPIIVQLTLDEIARRFGRL